MKNFQYYGQFKNFIQLGIWQEELGKVKQSKTLLIGKTREVLIFLLNQFWHRYFSVGLESSPLIFVLTNLFLLLLFTKNLNSALNKCVSCYILSSIEKQNQLKMLICGITHYYLDDTIWTITGFETVYRCTRIQLKCSLTCTHYIYKIQSRHHRHHLEILERAESNA